MCRATSRFSRTPAFSSHHSDRRNRQHSDARIGLRIHRQAYHCDRDHGGVWENEGYFFKFASSSEVLRDWHPTIYSSHATSVVRIRRVPACTTTLTLANHLILLACSWVTQVIPISKPMSPDDRSSVLLQRADDQWRGTCHDGREDRYSD
jgi:hypothetical protein